MQRGEHADPRCAVSYQILSERAIHLPGIDWISVFRFSGKGIGFEPLQQRSIHAGAHILILRSMQVHIGKALQDQRFAKVFHLRFRHVFWQDRAYPYDDAVLQNKVTVRMDAQRVRRQCFQDVALQCGQHDCMSSFVSISCSSSDGTAMVRSKSGWAAIT